MAIKPKAKAKVVAKKPAPRAAVKTPAKRAVQRDIEDDPDDAAQELARILEDVPSETLAEAVLAEITRRVDAVIEAKDDTPEEIAALWLHVKDIESNTINVRRALEDSLHLIFPATELEGTEDHELEGYAVKIVHKVTRTVDPEKLTELSEEYEIDDEIARLFRFKPELNLAVFRAEDEEMQDLFNKVITTKQARPSVTITAVEQE